MRALVVRVLSFAVALGVLVSHARPAEAQTVSVNSANVTRSLYQTAFRPSSQKPFAVNQADCINHDVFTFSVTLSGNYSGQNFQVWAGTADCTQVTQRTAAGSQCWQVFAGTYSGLTGGVADVPIFARNIVARNYPTTAAGAAVTSDAIPEANVSVCYAGGGAFQALNLTFMLVDSTSDILPGGTSNTAFAIYKGPGTGTSLFGYDITAPAPPSDIVLGAGEGRIHVSWTASTDSDVYGFNFYCDPKPGPLSAGADAGLLNLGSSLRTQALPGPDSGVPGSGGSIGAGGAPGIGGADAGASKGGAAGSAGGTAGASGAIAAAGSVSTDAGTSTDGGPITGTSCSGGPSPLAAGAVPDPAYLCGQTIGNPIGTGTGTAENLVNGQIYGVAVGAIDGVGNVGVLSAPQCETPVVITDFFELYRGYGGRGGCSIARVTDRRGPALLTALGVAASLTTLRRRRRRW